MLRINKLHINIVTSEGPYGLRVGFNSGLNIVRATNNAGKSTIFQSILYGLGLEELLGAKNDKAMQSVLKDEILGNDKKKVANVLQSSILLEIENKEIVTVERFVKSDAKDPKLVVVYRGTLEDVEKGIVLSEPMFVHDPGAARDGIYGFHTFLEQFLDISLPEIEYNDGRKGKLYLQNIFPAFVIEQKVGWSDFMATIPYYPLREKEKKAIEFLLALDSAKIEEEKGSIVRERNILEEKWKELNKEVNNLARRAGCEVDGIEDKPMIFTARNPLRLRILEDDSWTPFLSHIEKMTAEVVRLEEEEIPKIEFISKAKEAEMKSLEELIERLESELDVYYTEKQNTIMSLNSIKQRNREIVEDLEHNRNHQKVLKLGAKEGVSTALGICPTCGQPINDSLLTQDKSVVPMGIDDNVEFLKAQRSMADLYIKTHESGLNQLEIKIAYLVERISETKQTIRSIKRDLISDGRLPSTEMIERRIKLRTKLDYFNRVTVEMSEFNERFKQLGKDHAKVLEDLKKFDELKNSKNDQLKVKTLNDYFKKKLVQFGYGSKAIGGLGISGSKLIPVASGDSNISYNMRFDSSASDLVRAIQAFTCALAYTSKKFYGNFPEFIMMDEPGNQVVAKENLKSLFQELSDLKGQSIIFSSPEGGASETREEFLKYMEGIKFSLIRPNDAKVIQPLNKEYKWE